jgi:adenylate cyclase
MRLSRRHLRLGSGLAMFTYIALHMANHALGLVSLDAAERGLELSVALWHSWPGSALLFGSAAVHLSLAFLAIHEKRSLRIAPIEAVRIAAGLTIPLLLIGHLASTRIAFELFDAAPRYARVVGAIWANQSEARQLGLMAPGWLHGCLGIHIAAGRARWYRRVRVPLLLAAIALPAAAAAGFLSMVADVAGLGVVPPRDAFAGKLAGVRDTLIEGYLLAVAAVFLARWLRHRDSHRATPPADPQ